MFCPKCGNRLGDDAVFCSECGTRIVNSNQMINTSNLVTTHIKEPPANLGWLTLLCTISIILCWPAAIYGFIQRSKAAKAETTEEANVIVNATIKGILIWNGVAFAIGFFAAFL